MTGGRGCSGQTLLETAPAGWGAFATSYRTAPPPERRDRFFVLDVQEEIAVTQVCESIRPDVVIPTASGG